MDQNNRITENKAASRDLKKGKAGNKRREHRKYTILIGKESTTLLATEVQLVVGPSEEGDLSLCSQFATNERVLPRFMLKRASVKKYKLPC